MLSRRALIGKAAVGAVTALALGAAARTVDAATRALRPGPDDSADDRDRHEASARAETPGRGQEGAPPAEAVTSSAPPPWELVQPLVAGAALAHGWQLVDLSAVRNGSCVATLKNARGRAHRIHLCRNDGTPQGIVYTRRVDLVVMNEGQGDLPTEEHLAQAVAALAHAIAANEATVPGPVFADLLPHTERVRRFAAADGLSAEGKLR
jgi:hypothetical protein